LIHFSPENEKKVETLFFLPFGKGDTELVNHHLFGQNPPVQETGFKKGK